MKRPSLTKRILVTGGAGFLSSSGTIALYSWGNAGSCFDDIVVENLTGGNRAPIISSVTATPSTISDANVDCSPKTDPVLVRV